jgi:hypothetical protein
MDQVYKKYTNIFHYIQDPLTFTQIWIFWLKTNHLATLHERPNLLELCQPKVTRISRSGWYVFQTENPDLDKFWRSLEWKKVGTFCGHLEYIMVIWYRYFMAICPQGLKLSPALGVKTLCFPLCSSKEKSEFTPGRERKVEHSH